MPVQPSQSRPVLSAECSSTRFVLRKKPAGQLLSKTAHQVEREYTMLRALHKHNTNPSTPPNQRVPIPEPVVLCEDVNVIGTPFYIMEFLDGRIFTDPRMPEVPPETRREWCVSRLSSWPRVYRQPQSRFAWKPLRLSLVHEPESSCHCPCPPYSSLTGLCPTPQLAVRCPCTCYPRVALSRGARLVKLRIQ